MLSYKNKLSYYTLLISALLLAALTLHDRPTPHYPHISLTNADRVQIDFLWQAEISARACIAKINLLDEVVKADCPDCQIKTQACLEKLNPIQKSWLGNDEVGEPTVRLSNGVVAYQALDPQMAQQACSNTQDMQVDYNHQLTCTPAYAKRSIKLTNDHDSWVDLIEMLIVILSTGLASWFICYLILRYEDMHSQYSHDHIDSGIQKFHAQPTPRIAGIALLAALLCTLSIELILHEANFSSGLAMTYFVLACLPVFFGGIIEDVTKNVGVGQRLFFSIISALMAVWLLGGLINRTDIMTLDGFLILTPVAVAFTVLGIAGVCNAMNIIDGCNGIASGYAAITLAAISCIAFQVNDHLVLFLSLGLMGGLLGFLCWNWPHGKIFMGDGGAYLIGFSMAELSILFLFRNPAVSPWFTAILIAYPITETLFSMFRRKFIAKTKTGQPDAKHFHQLVFSKILHGQQYTDAKQLTWANSRVALFIWLPALLVSIVGTIFWNSTAVLMPLTLLGCVIYVLVYYKLLSMPD
jgi:UDP-N-acetylmuramyl pentapeptide phosphotransferase/UDP-N-acetylglucosamine-1-phosphate transferase